MSIVTRFAPSPTGYLHPGHAYAAWVAWGKARAAGGRFLLRLEDIDATRCRPEFAAAIYEDLRWLGLDWDGEVRVQSGHLAAYEAAFAGLQASGLIYPCFCSRAEIARAQSAPHGANVIYPGTCRTMSSAEREERTAAGQKYARRLDVAKAARAAGDLRFFEENSGWVSARPDILGDVVLGRSDIATSYHLCVVCDDAAQGVTHVTRGDDLADATHVQVLLQSLLGLPVPVYAHHGLLVDEQGKRLAKRDGAMSLRAMRAAGASRDEILARLRMAVRTSHNALESRAK
jgi:glutamyl-Q tRNA(Asp) synthetase